MLLYSWALAHLLLAKPDSAAVIANLDSYRRSPPGTFARRPRIAAKYAAQITSLYAT